MRTLLLMRGIPASGKSSWIESHNLKAYALSPDSLRLMAQSPQLQPNGSYAISQENDNKVWKMLLEILQMRMEKGDFTIIDATHIKNSAIRRYEELCAKYRYRIAVLDCSDVSLEVAKERNKMRGFKSVREEVIERMQADLQVAKKEPLPSRYKVIKPNEIDEIRLKPLDLSHYKKVHHIGDIHGSFSALIEYLQMQSKRFSLDIATQKLIQQSLEAIVQRQDSNTESSKDTAYNNLALLLNSDEYYIFLGDYIDRGVENGKVVRFLLQIMEMPNVCLLEGNHERWLRKWGEGEAVCKEFSLRTQKDLENENLTPKDARNLYRKLRQCSFYRYEEKVIIATHGGLSNLPHTFLHKKEVSNANNCTQVTQDSKDFVDSINLLLLSSQQIIYGSGDYEDMQESTKSFFANTPKNFYQVFGHRNRERFPMQMYQRSFALEGSVEFGGDLRVMIVESKNASLDSSKDYSDSNRESSPTTQSYDDTKNLANADSKGTQKVLQQCNNTESTMQKITQDCKEDSNNTESNHISESSHNCNATDSIIKTESFGNGLSGIYVRNKVYRDKTEHKLMLKLNSTIEGMRQSSSIKEKIFYNGRVSSFNFSKDVFYKKKWDSLNCKARGFFIDNADSSIIARSYDKFFNLNEREETTLENLQKTLCYPLNAFVKENGFLGILGVFDGQLFFTSKSDPTSKFARIFQDIFEKSIDKETQARLLEKMHKDNISLVFEVIEPHLDPHIIEYAKPQIILLDVIYNRIDFAKLPFCELIEFAKEFGFTHKINALESLGDICSNQDLLDFIHKVSDKDFRFHNQYIEGFVIEDANGFSFKLKLSYYTMWKSLREFVNLCIENKKIIKMRFHNERNKELQNVQNMKNAKDMQEQTQDETITQFCQWYAKKAEQSGFENLKDSNIIALRKEFLSKS